MSHPTNKADRFLKGKNKGTKRAKSLLGAWAAQTPIAPPECLDKTAKKTRHTTKLCSCSMCGNPRKFFKEDTMQEKKFKEACIE